MQTLATSPFISLDQPLLTIVQFKWFFFVCYTCPQMVRAIHLMCSSILGLAMRLQHQLAISFHQNADCMIRSMFTTDPLNEANNVTVGYFYCL